MFQSSIHPAGLPVSSTSLLSRHMLPVLACLVPVSLMATPVKDESTIPDLTKGERAVDRKGAVRDPLEKDINLGPTGMKGWMYHVSVDSSMARQILVTVVEEGSPAAGKVMVDDVILGVDGKGAEPKPFDSDPRVALGKAIGDAEARKPALLNLLVWRAGKTQVVGLELQHLGFYADTAPYNCVKSVHILENGLKHLMATQDEGVWSMNALPLMACNYPGHPDNEARQAKAREWARLLILPQHEIDKRLNGYVSGQSKVGWTRGHELLVLAEYYLQTKDPDVFPTLEAMAVEVCNGFSHLGTHGHQFSNPVLNGKFNGPYNIGYGAINSAGMPSFMGLLLAKKCGVTRPELDPAIARATNFFGSFVSYGALPYGEHGPGRDSHESNGKVGLAALLFATEGSRPEATRFFSKMAAASASEREVGHCGAYFNYLWAPLGANAGGEQAAAAHFSRISWRLDLNRTWDGGFDYDCWYHYTTGGPKYAGRSFWATIPPLLTYAMPLRQLVITGKGLDGSGPLTADEVASTGFADTYDATTRSTAELITDLGFWSPKVQSQAAKQLAARKDELEAVLPQLLALAGNDGAGEQRVGACFALGEIKDGRAAEVLAALLTHPDEELRWAATTAMRAMPREQQLEHLETMLKACVSTQRPFEPLSDRVPLQFAHAQLTYLLFYNGTAYGPRGVIAGDQLGGVDRALLYPAIEAAAKTPMGHSRGSLSATFKYLTGEDVLAVSGALIDVAQVPAPADNMFKSGVRTDALTTLQQHKIAEGALLAMQLADDPNLRGRDKAMDELASYAKAASQVVAPSTVLKFCERLMRREPTLAAKAQAVLDAIAADKEPATLTRLKAIEKVTADKPMLTLPETLTTLRVEGLDLAKGDAIYHWRKVHGAGKVTFSENATAAAKETTVQIDGTPGKYRFEVTMTDSRGLTEAKGEVGVVLKASLGQMPGNRRPLAATHNVRVNKSTTTPIVLQGKDPEGRELVFTVTEPPARGRLSGTAPLLSYTPAYGFSGKDSFRFQVTDSEGQTAAGTVNLQVASQDTLQVAVYEPFDYPAGPLDGQSGRSEVGLDGKWSASEKNAMVGDGSLDFASLPAKGGKYLSTGGRGWGGTRAILPAALQDNGLLADGATLWFSAVVGYGPKSDYRRDWLRVALATHGFDQGNSTTWILDDGEQPGRGVGFTLASHDAGSVGGRPQASLFLDASRSEDNGANVHGSWDDEPTLIPAGGQGLVVGRISWAADPAQADRIEIFGPLSDLELPAAPVSTLEVTVDQSGFDTLSFTKSGDVLLDEIRFGPSYESVLAGTVALKPVKQE